MRRIRSAICGLLALGAVGCKDQLVVDNNNNPDRDRALARPTDVENLVGTQYRIIHNAWWNVTNTQAQLAVMGMESFSTNANFGMGVRSGIPRSLVDNGRGNPADTYGTFLSLNQAARAAALALSALDDPNFTFFPTSVAQTQRARAFAYFILGVSQGYTALVWDSTAIITPIDDPAVSNPLASYGTVMAKALVDLDSAIAIASISPAPSGPTGTGFPLPATWINGNTTITGGATGTFVQLVRSFKARLRAGVARTPAERAAVDWVAVIADANAGIAADMSVFLTNVTGGWFYRPMQMDLYQSWHQMWQGFVGMADSSGNYNTWLNTPRALKTPFVVISRDRRIPSGTTRAAQNTSSGCGASACTQPAGTTPYPYLRNRPSGQDVGVDGMFHSYYDFYRFQTVFDANRNNVNMVFFTRTELDLLAAEGHIRAGTFATAMTLINNTRVARGQLPALAGITTLADVVPGGNACVPRVPVGATSALTETPTATACGNIMEALKWEKRLEAAFVNPGGWWTDARGWGDLPFNTPIQFPVPFTELDSRRQAIYNLPAAGGTGATTATGAERLSNSASNYGYGN